jgi:hypothetical protein
VSSLELLLAPQQIVPLKKNPEEDFYFLGIYSRD